MYYAKISLLRTVLLNVVDIYDVPSNIILLPVFFSTVFDCSLSKDPLQSQLWRSYLGHFQSFRKGKNLKVQQIDLTSSNPWAKSRFIISTKNFVNLFYTGFSACFSLKNNDNL